LNLCRKRPEKHSTGKSTWAQLIAQNVKMQKEMQIPLQTSLHMAAAQAFDA
jgi:hypothetical protein